MLAQRVEMQADADNTLPVDYARLVRLCAHLSGDPQAAEDLAQDTLVEAWRHRHKVQQAAGWEAWLTAIARNVCLRWKSARYREKDRCLESRPGESAIVPEIITRIADTADIELDLERTELAKRIGIALARLPRSTRLVLIERYLHDMPQAMVAERLGLSEAAVESRLHRGKKALRRVLAPSEGQQWETTRLWCPSCGQHHLQGQFDPASGAFGLRCPTCFPMAGLFCQYSWPALFAGVQGYKPALGRVRRWAHAFYQPALTRGTVTCIGCESPLPLHREQAPQTVAAFPSQRTVPGVHAQCGACGVSCSMRLSNLALYLPQVWQFWCRHPRMQNIPGPELEVDSRAAFTMRFRSMAETAYIDVISACDNYQVIGIHEHSGH